MLIGAAYLRCSDPRQDKSIEQQRAEVQQRADLEATIAELDRRIRLVGQQVVDGILAPADAKALNAPLRAQRETAQLRLAALPERRELPDAVDPDRFREAVLEAWTARPLDDRRAALDRLLDRITLDEGGAHIEYRAKDEPPAFRHQAPSGPPLGAGVGNGRVGWVGVGVRQVSGASRDRSPGATIQERG